MKKTRLSAVASLLAAGVLMGGCMADFGGESEGEEVAAQGPSVVEGDALGEAQQALSNTSPVAAGESHTLAVKSDGTVWAWGLNSSGQLGDGVTTPPSYRSTPLPVLDLTGVVSVAAGDSHSLAVTSDGTLWAWGNNSRGQLGDGTKKHRRTPVPVPGLAGVVAMAANRFHSLAVTSDGTLWAWGYNGYGQLGDGTKTDRLKPKPVLTGVVAVAAGNSYSLAVKSDGTLWAWGYNGYGQLGDGTTTDSLKPKPVLTGVVAVAAGSSHSLALKSDGTLRAWGANVSGQLGDGTTKQSLTPVPVLGLTDVVAVTAGTKHTLAVKSNGTLWAWGINLYGRLGNGKSDPSPQTTPQLVNLPGGVVALGAGSEHSMAVKSDGTLWTWGFNQRGQVGGTAVFMRLTPGQLPGLPVKL